VTTGSSSASGRFFLTAEVETRGAQLKEGRAGRFSVLCDEGPALGGQGSAPPPLHYFLLATGF
jgi:hypothetical protein